MTSLAATLHTSALPARIVASWNAAAARWNPIAVIVVAWAVLAVPLVFFRGYSSHEGLAVSIARTALETGDWLTPHMYNVRFVERPTLQSWIIAAISAPFGEVNQITARLPSVLFLLFGCLLIYWLLRRVAASVPAALLGVALFLACPLVMRSYVMITADLPLAVLLFFAFVLWWSGYAQESISVSRWLAIGVVLALAGLLKGPQPVGYFALGVGLFVVGTRSWRQIPGLLLAGLICAVPLVIWYGLTYTPGDEATWRAFMRLAQPRESFSGPIGASLRVHRRYAAGHAACRGVSDCLRVSRKALCPPAIHGGAGVLRFCCCGVDPVLAGGLDAALLFADGVAAVRVRRPRLRSAQRAAAATGGAHSGADRAVC